MGLIGTGSVHMVGRFTGVSRITGMLLAHTTFVAAVV
jgi:hypothetical protein